MQRSPIPLILAGLAACGGGSGGSSGSAAQAVRWYVDADATPGGSGRTWSQAFDDLQDALAVAAAGQEIWVAGGEYRPSARGDRAVSFALKGSVRVYGGFAGQETARAQRDPVANPTILTGDLAGDDGPDFAGTEENSYHVVVATDVFGAALDGFIVCGGRADGPGLGPTPDSQDQGSGINLYGGSVEIRRCTLLANWSANHGAINDHSQGSVVLECAFVENRSEQFGAGLYLHHHTQTLAQGCSFVRNVAVGDGAGAYTRSHFGALFLDCTFEENRALRGAGIYAAPESGTHLEHCAFRANAAEVGGGGSYNDEAFTVLSQCTFESNEAGTEVDGGGGGGGGSGGGGVWANGGEPVVRECHFEDNLASFGGGFYAIHGCIGYVESCTFVANRAQEAGGAYSLDSPVRLSDCTFEANVAEGGAFSVGGAVSNYFSDAIVQRCTFRGNSAWLGGGALYSEGAAPVVRACRFEGNRSTGGQGFGGAMMNGYFTAARIEDCAFTGNVGREGGGTYDIAFSEAAYANCTFAGNAAESGGGLFAGFLSTPTFANCIVVQCTPDAIDGEPVTFVYGCVQGGHPGAGNIDAVPGFVRPPDAGADGLWGTPDDDHGDLALLAGSACIDAGWNGGHLDKAETDIDGLPRFVDDPVTPDSGEGMGPIVDIGCHEHAP